jgi:hypothetical protein
MTEVLTPAVDECSSAPPATDPFREARLAAVVAVLAAVLAAGLAAFGLAQGTDATGVVVAGALETVPRGEDGRALAVGEPVPDDVLVRAAASGATIRVAGTDVELLPGTSLQLGGDVVALVGGSVLVAGGEPALVRVGSAELRGRGVWRVDVGSSGRVAAYRGRVQIDDGARALQLARYEQVDLRDGDLGGTALPLRYRERDAWDRVHLAEALSVDRLARQLATSLTASHGADLRSTTFYASFAGTDGVVLDRLDDLAPRVLDGRVGPPADVLLGIAVADALVQDAGFLPRPALSRVIALRRGGATWGLLLVVHDLGPAALEAAAGRALDRAAADGAGPGDAAGGAAATGAGSEGAADGTTSTPGGPSTASAPATGPSPSPAPSPGASPSPTPAPSPSPADPPDDDPVAPGEELLREGTETLTDLLEGVGGVLSGTSGAG